MKEMTEPVRRLFRELEAARVKYAVIGRTAAVFFGVDVMTYDVDIILDRPVSNVKRLYRALLKLKAVDRMPSTREIELFLSEKVTRFRVGLFVLDVLKWQDGFPKSAWKRVRKKRYGGVLFCVAHLHDLIETKSQTGRPKDASDVRRLKKILESSENHP